MTAALRLLQHEVEARFPGTITRFLKDINQRLTSSAFTRRYDQVFKEVGQPAQIMQGPFAGMHYGGYPHTRPHLCKLLGTVECEIQSFIETICAAQPDVIVNVGSAEGYYSVGFARRLPQTQVYAFDILRWCRFLLHHLARRNGVGKRVKSGSFCTPATLQSVIATARKPVVFSDCEGYEMTLLDQHLAPDLERAIILVECHDVFQPGITDAMERRFGGTHDIQKITSRPRTPADLPQGIKLPEIDAIWAMDEGRPGPMNWLLMLPHDQQDA